MLDVRLKTLATSPFPVPATEASFTNPGAYPWRQDMVPYVDERYRVDAAGDSALVSLGLEWHAKLLQRIELTGTLVNAYNTGLEGADSNASAV